jgi:hypothetical protein
MKTSGLRTHMSVQATTGYLADFVQIVTQTELLKLCHRLLSF